MTDDELEPPFYCVKCEQPAVLPGAVFTPHAAHPLMALACTNCEYVSIR